LLTDPHPTLASTTTMAKRIVDEAGDDDIRSE
jgi:hypothetical protein